LEDKYQAFEKENVAWIIDVEEFPIIRIDSTDGIISG
jgi:hypothetical protein